MRRSLWRIFSISFCLVTSLACGDPEDCSAAGDEDENGFSNCGDPACQNVEVCKGNCGDGTVNGTEECDGTALGGQDCTSQGFGGGTLLCADDCTFNTNLCGASGEDCLREGDEDGDKLENCDDPDCASSPACVPAAVCGDGIAQPPEECDDDNTTNGDGCDSNCQLENGSCSHDVCVEGEALVNGCNPCVAALCAADDFCCDGIDGAWDDVCVEEVPEFCGLQCAQPPENLCNDLDDDDGDGFFDCQDPDCQILGECTPGSALVGEPCSANVDCQANGADPLCLDEFQFGFVEGYCSEYCNPNSSPECSGDGTCVDLGLGGGLGICLDACSGNEDCRDSYSCQDALGDGSLFCFPVPTFEFICDDGLDDDLDGLTDCSDDDCEFDFACTEFICDDDLDDDNDGFIDCEDSDCEFDFACQENICNDGLDDEGDGLIDCADSDCDFDFACVEICNNGIDDDNDGALDCLDAFCEDDSLCSETGAECLDTLDNDNDTLTDCADPDCADIPFCEETVCNDSIDNDGDGLTDCADTGFCTLNVQCPQNIACGNGVLQAGEVCDDGNTNSGDGCEGDCLSFTPNACTHDICTPDQGPLTPGCDSPAPDCVSIVCAIDDFCCDTEWDSLCVDEVEEFCGPLSCTFVGGGICGNGSEEPGEQCDDANTVGGDGCSDNCAIEPPICGNGVVEIFEQCDDGNVGEGDGCDALCQLEETVCNDLTDDDNDGLFDCQDPFSCNGTAACTPGNGAVGDPCTAPTDCQSVEGGDPFCLDEAQFFFPGGACAEYCDLNAPACSGDGFCADIDLGTGSGLCLDACAINTDCRPGYTCQDAFNLGQLMCAPGLETICDDGLDDEQDGLADCADPDCNQEPACAVCGNGIAQAGEQCDDGNLVDGDGCSAACLLEGVVQESEPNNASGAATSVGVPDVVSAGSIFGADVDFFSVTLTAGSTVEFQTSDINGLTSCENDIDTTLTLFDIDGNTDLDFDDDGAGIGLCSFLEFNVPVSGTYFIEAASFDESDVPAYLLFITVQ